jgi:cytidylate kinase
MVRMMEGITAMIAEEGNAVVVGRGAPYFLRSRADTFRVFLYAPREEKVRRLISSGTSLEEADELVDTVDRERMAFIKHYFNADWPTRSLYHLMINTVVGDENVVATILETMALLQGSSPVPEPAMRGLSSK